MTTDDAFPDVVGAIEKWRMGRRSIGPARSVRASELGHPCERWLVYRQVVQPTELYSVRLQGIFDRGKAAETQAFIDYSAALQGTDMELVRQQDEIPPNEWGIGGRIDWWLRKGRDGLWPCEFKSCTARLFDSILSVSDMLNHRWPHCRKWPAQLTTYMALKGKAEGLFLLRCVEDFRDRQVQVEFDRSYADSLLAKAARVKRAVEQFRAAGAGCTDAQELALPPRVQYEPSLCDDCDYRKQCIPDIGSAPGVDNRLWDVELNALCRLVDNPLAQDGVSKARWEEAQKEAEQAKERVKAHARSVLTGLPAGERRVTLTQDFRVEGLVSSSTQYNVPDEVKRKYAEKVRRELVTIRATGSKGSD